MFTFHRSSFIFLLLPHLLRLNTEGGVRNGAEARFIDELTGDAANTIGLILDAHQCLFEVVDEGDLTAGHLTQLFTLHAYAAIFHGHVACILEITTFILAGDESLQIRKFFLGRIQFPTDDLTEFSQIRIGITHGGTGR